MRRGRYALPGPWSSNRRSGSGRRAAPPADWPRTRLAAQAANPRKVDLKILRWRGPGHHAAVEDLPSVAPDLENHAAAAADLVIDADHRRERRTRSIRTELHRGRGPGAEPLGMAGTVQ